LLAHLNRYKRYPSGAASTGTASVAFTIARSGQVLSARLIGSSGNPALDAEAVSLPRRASPVPARRRILAAAFSPSLSQSISADETGSAYSCGKYGYKP
jgi:TonB family protein